jgi:hypothetical protein
MFREKNLANALRNAHVNPRERTRTTEPRAFGSSKRVVGVNRETRISTERASRHGFVGGRASFQETRTAGRTLGERE